MEADDTSRMLRTEPTRANQQLLYVHLGMNSQAPCNRSTSQHRELSSCQGFGTQDSALCTSQWHRNTPCTKSTPMKSNAAHEAPATAKFYFFLPSRWVMLFNALGTNAWAVHTALARTTKLYRLLAPRAPHRASVRVAVSQKQLLLRRAIDAVNSRLERSSSCCWIASQPPVTRMPLQGQGTIRVMILNGWEAS